MPSARRATFDELKQLVHLLHKRGQYAWYFLQQWRDITLFFSERPQLWTGTEMFWHSLRNHSLEIAVLRLTGLMEDGRGCGIPWILQVAERLSDAPGWAVPQAQVLAGVAEDLLLLGDIKTRADELEAYRNQRLAHYDPRVIHNPDGVEHPCPFTLRDCLYDCSKILNRYSEGLGLGEYAWWTEGLDGFGSVSRLLELGFDYRQSLLSPDDDQAEGGQQAKAGAGSPRIDRFLKNLEIFERDWRKQGRLTALPDAPEDRALTGWMWNFMDRRERDIAARRARRM